MLMYGPTGASIEASSLHSSRSDLDRYPPGFRATACRERARAASVSRNRFRSAILLLAGGGYGSTFQERFFRSVQDRDGATGVHESPARACSLRPGVRGDPGPAPTEPGLRPRVILYPRFSFGSCRRRFKAPPRRSYL
jgi:hypothetical protein